MASFNCNLWVIDCAHLREISQGPGTMQLKNAVISNVRDAGVVGHAAVCK